MRVESLSIDHPDAVALRAAQEVYGDELYASDPAPKPRFASEVLDPASVLLIVVGSPILGIVNK